MCEISLLCTVHLPTGLATPEILGELLGSLKPQVIFLEVPVDHSVEDWKAADRKTLESTAVQAYQALNQSKLVPVDRPTPPIRFFDELNFMIRSLTGTCDEYRRLRALDDEHVRNVGFSYLNSKACEDVWSKTYTAMRAGLQRLNDERLNTFFENWIKVNELRETEMLANITRFAQSHSFERAVFLVGAAHRAALIQKIKSSSAPIPNRTSWKFDTTAF